MKHWDADEIRLMLGAIPDLQPMSAIDGAAGARPPSTRAAGRRAAANSRHGRAHIQ